jgi:hypothetical protein
VDLSSKEFLELSEQCIICNSSNLTLNLYNDIECCAILEKVPAGYKIKNIFSYSFTPELLGFSGLKMVEPGKMFYWLAERRGNLQVYCHHCMSHLRVLVKTVSIFEPRFEGINVGKYSIINPIGKETTIMVVRNEWDCPEVIKVPGQQLYVPGTSGAMILEDLEDLLIFA